MKVIHDGDAAYEDLMALSLLLLNADVVAATVTYGESTPKTGAENVERVCRMLKPSIKIPVAYGINAALDEHGTPFPNFITKEADTILDGTTVPQITDSLVSDAPIKLMYDTLMSSNEKITLVATGPLTNIAQLLSEHPDCISKIENVVIMGGAVNVAGNISDLINNPDNLLAEWNIYADPKAAEIVFSCPALSIMLVPIDITCQMPMTRTFYKGLSNETAPALILVREMLTTLLKGMGEEMFYGKLQFWDSLSAMITLNPSMAVFEELALTIDLATSQTKIAESSESTVARIQVATKLKDVSAAYDVFLQLMKTKIEPVMIKSNFQDNKSAFFETAGPTILPQATGQKNGLDLSVSM